MDNQKQVTVGDIVSRNKDNEIGRLSGKVIELETYNRYLAEQNKQLADKLKEYEDKEKPKDKKKSKKGE